MLAIASAALLVACGGGGSSSGVVSPTPLPSATLGPQSASTSTALAATASAAPVAIPIPAAGWENGGTITLASVIVQAGAGNSITVTSTAAVAPPSPLPPTALNGTVLAYIGTTAAGGALHAVGNEGGVGNGLGNGRRSGWTVDVDLAVAPQFANQACVVGVVDPMFVAAEYTDAVGGPVSMSAGRCRLTIPYENTPSLDTSPGGNVVALGYVVLAVPLGSTAPPTPGPVTVTPPSGSLPPSGSTLTIVVQQPGYAGTFQTGPPTAGCAANQFSPGADPQHFVIHGPGNPGLFCERFDGASGWYATFN